MDTAKKDTRQAEETAERREEEQNVDRDGGERQPVDHTDTK